MGKGEQQRVRALLTEAITVLCKNGLKYKSKFSIEGLLGITIDDDEIVLVNINETVKEDKGYSSDSSNEANSHGKKAVSPLTSCIDKSSGRSRPRKQEAPMMSAQAIACKPVKRLAPEPAWSPAVKKAPQTPLSQPIMVKEEVDPEENIGMTAAEMNMLLWQQSQHQAAAMAVAAAAALSTPSHLSHLGFGQPSTAVSGRSPKTSWSYGSGTKRTPPAVSPREDAVGKPERTRPEALQSDQAGESDFLQIARTILKLEGSFISARVIRRRYQRYSTELIVSTMKSMTKSLDDDMYVGEYHSLRKKIQVFYKCPPEKITQEALSVYNMPLDLYTSQYYKSARPAKGGPFDWAAYYSIVQSAAPYPLPEDSPVRQSDLLLSPNHPPYLDLSTSHLPTALASPSQPDSAHNDTMWESGDDNPSHSPKVTRIQPQDPPVEFKREPDEDVSQHHVSEDDSLDTDRLNIVEETTEIVSSSTLEQLRALTRSIPTTSNSPLKNAINQNNIHADVNDTESNDSS